MDNILASIVAKKRVALEKRKKELPFSSLKEQLGPRSQKRSFFQAVSRKHTTNIIAEIKRASPSAGIIAHSFDPSAIAQSYSVAGAAAISVLTEEDRFKGDITYLRMARDHSTIPILRKDFIFDEYQIYEAAVFGADALLLIAAMLTTEELERLHTLAASLHLDCLVEVHNREELSRVLSTSAKIIGINNRNLKTLSVDLAVSDALIAQIPKDKIVVVESGIKTRADIERFISRGVNTFLIGETIMRSPNSKAMIQNLLGVSNG
jgi:indole-3-glycerol phosphate synthase